jgi:two-component system sensor histidine kinase KdpD
MPDSQDPRRPDPDALLSLAAQERRGKLKVFLGAAPGVGKTFAMLQGLQRLKAEGIDVVVGLVETHGRAETAALIDGLEILPRRMIEYRGRELDEFDLDAALARRPKLIVVDELAHSNVPESRHPKRWQDVVELLDAGIDVWTALNIQHLESLADVVARVTGVAVRETVPDRVIQAATDVVLVDIPPAELIQRLKEGKVYLPETAKRATQNFFTLGNLTALRELALRRTADRVDEQMVDYLRAQAIEGPWDTSDHLLVCIGVDAQADAVVRAAGRLATRLNASWVAIHVERPNLEETNPEGLKRIEDACQLAERLGATVHRVIGSDLVGEVLRYARRENVTQIVVGRSQANRWWLKFARRFTAEIVRLSVDIPVHVVNAPEETKRLQPARWRWPKPDRFAREAGAAILAVAAAVGLSAALSVGVRLPNLSMIFLLAVLFCAARFGLWSAIGASFLSFLAYNYFFIEPLYTFSVAEPQELLALVIFLIVSVFTGSLAARVRDQAQAVRRRAVGTQLLYDFSRKLSGAAKRDEVLWASSTYLQKAQGGHIVFLMPDEGDLIVGVSWPPDVELTAGEMSAARWALQKREPAGWRTNTLPTMRFQFRPLITPRGVVSVCGFEPRDKDQPISPEDERALTAILEQTAIAIDRSLLIGEAVRAAALEDNEKLRTTLLASLSHDLRTPLSSITGAVTTLRQLGEQMTAPERQDLLASIEEEAGRLTRFVVNLLDMSRIESGAMTVKRDFVDVADVVRTSVERSRKAFPDVAIETSLARDLPFIRGDANLLEQVLFNLFDNAQKYGGEDGAIVHARREAGDVVISITDEGPGIKPGDLGRVFEKFYRGGRTDGRKAGTGLGLSICKGLVEAMGGKIEAQSPAVKRRGTRMILRFPAVEAKETRPQ